MIECMDQPPKSVAAELGRNEIELAQDEQRPRNDAVRANLESGIAAPCAQAASGPAQHAKSGEMHYADGDLALSFESDEIAPIREPPQE